ncbi:MAG: hypothetical protein BEN18_07845 [Epulopiscium sp. Nuni2H_MBin001]|nr:MAG: hypothetical protein BEN18_07845 [Epulopiscium sp. Nuni2H_MBin001]
MITCAKIEDRLVSNLNCNIISRGENDFDVFIKTKGNVIDVLFPHKLQFIGMEAILVRFGAETEEVTIHILQHTDLHSSVANFEISLNAQRLYIYYDEKHNKVVLKRAI